MTNRIGALLLANIFLLLSVTAYAESSEVPSNPLTEEIDVFQSLKHENDQKSIGETIDYRFEDSYSHFRGAPESTESVLSIGDRNLLNGNAFMDAGENEEAKEENVNIFLDQKETVEGVTTNTEDLARQLQVYGRANAFADDTNTSLSVSEEFYDEYKKLENDYWKPPKGVRP